ncbi:MAG: hypothetical protein WCP91_02790 [Candidatus Berkelbacteria bacterium]
MKKYLVPIGILFLLAVFCLPNVRVLALDASDETPTINWGSPSASWTDGGQNYTTYYQGVSTELPDASISHATDVFRNVAPATLPDLIFNKNCLLDAKDSSLASVGQCVNFNGPSSMQVFNSRTYANSFLKSATAVIEYPSINVIGDSFNSSGNFAYWGQHLHQTADSTDGSNALWKQTSYQFNSAAQAFWKNSDSNKNTAMTDTINRLMQNAKALSAGATNLITVSFNGICYPLPFSNNSCTEANQYSDGRVWYSNGQLTLTGGVTYSSKATIIVKTGDLIIDGSVQAPVSNPNSGLGFIVQGGNVVIQNKTSPHKKIYINASIFAPNGSIQIKDPADTNPAHSLWGSDIDLTGSFVAQGFSVPSVAGNINFIQDSRNESTWPPGFRDLQPLSSISK